MFARRLRWVAPVLVLGIAAVLRFWALGRPDALVFDELYYVRDAISQLTYGYPTVWPDSEPGMAGGRATAFTGDASNAVHPPLGKWLIGLGILVFGPDSGWGWRSAVAAAGVATVGVTMRLGWLLTRSLVIACMAGLLLAVDGVHVVLTRVGLLDGFLTLAVALGALFVWRDHEQVSEQWRDRQRGERTPILWRRPWLVAAGATFGAAAAIKWSGLYPLAFFLVLVTIRDLLIRHRIHRRTSGTAHRRRTGPAAQSLAQAAVTGALALPAAALVYLASWTGWIASSGGWGREPGTPWPVSLARYHAEMLDWHSTLSAPHPYQSHPITWPLALRPTAMHEIRWESGCPWSTGCVSGISPLPNPLVTWGGVAALLILAWLVARALVRALGKRDGGLLASPVIAASVFVLTGYLSGWLPWMLILSRSAVFQFYAVVLTPFSALALALLLGMLCGIPIRSDRAGSAGLRLDPDPVVVQSRRAAVALFLAFAVTLAVLFFPVWSGVPVAEWFWRVHLWLPGWA